jgi:Phosphotransferase enzyme family
VEEEVLSGGVANAGSVVRVGRHVLRPSNPHTESIHRLLRWSYQHGFSGAPVPIGTEVDGRERLQFIPGDVPLPPYPDWSQTNDALASVTNLIRGLHNSTLDFDQSGSTWSDELAQVGGGPVLCHNDVCLENVVFHHGSAIALLDFDFAAPGYPVHDLATFAKMCVPIDDDVNARRNGWVAADLPRRLRLVADTYELNASGRAELMAALDRSIQQGNTFVQRRVDAGDVNFIAMWNDMGGAERFKRRHAWWIAQRDEFALSLSI